MVDRLLALSILALNAPAFVSGSFDECFSDSLGVVSFFGGFTSAGSTGS